MSNENFVKERKFRALGISEADFETLPVEERLSRLVELKEDKEIDLAGVNDELSDTRRRRSEVDSLLSDTSYRRVERIETKENLERAWGYYRDAVHEQRVEIGRLAAYSRWYKVAERRDDVAKIRHYGIKIAVQREKLLPLKKKVAETRAVFGSLPRLRRMLRDLYREIATLRDAIDIYRDRIETLDSLIRMLRGQIHGLLELIDEIDSEIAEFKVEPKVVRHRYREVTFEIHKSMEYSSAKSGSDIDIEMTLAGVFKTLLPTRFEGNEDGWLEDIEVMFRNATCGVMDDCFTDEYFALSPDVDIRCNMVDRRVTKRTIANVSKFYKDLEPPISIRILRPILRREIERHTRLSLTLFQVMRSHALGKEKSRNTGAEYVISRCIKKQSSELLSELVDYSVAEELEELMRFLSEE